MAENAILNLHVHLHGIFTSKLCRAVFKKMHITSGWKGYLNWNIVKLCSYWKTSSDRHSSTSGCKGSRLFSPRYPLLLLFFRYLTKIRKWPLIEMCMTWNMIEKWEARIQAFCKLQTSFAKTNFHLFSIVNFFSMLSCMILKKHSMSSVLLALEFSGFLLFLISSTRHQSLLSRLTIIATGVSRENPRTLLIDNQKIAQV